MSAKQTVATAHVGVISSDAMIESKQMRYQQKRAKEKEKKKRWNYLGGDETKYKWEEKERYMGSLIWFSLLKNIQSMISSKRILKKKIKKEKKKNNIQSEEGKAFLDSNTLRLHMILDVVTLRRNIPPLTVGRLSTARRKAKDVTNGTFSAMSGGLATPRNQRRIGFELDYPKFIFILLKNYLFHIRFIFISDRIESGIKKSWVESGISNLIKLNLFKN